MRFKIDLPSDMSEGVQKWTKAVTLTAVLSAIIAGIALLVSLAGRHGN
jgi:hypothetical protein